MRYKVKLQRYNEKKDKHFYITEKVISTNYSISEGYVTFYNRLAGFGEFNVASFLCSDVISIKTKME